MKRTERHKIKRDDFSTFMISFIKKLKPYWKEVTAAVVVFLVIVVGGLSYKAYLNSKIEKANYDLSQLLFFHREVKLSSYPQPFPQMGALLRAEALADRRKYKDALSLLSEAPLKGRMKNFLLFAEGNIFYEQNKCDKALEVWKKIQPDDDFPYDAALAYMGRCYKNLGKEKESSAAYNQLLNLYKNSPFSAEANFKAGR